DEDGVRALARQALEAHGYQVLEARDGAQAVVRSKQYAGPIHLVLTDVVMPRLGGTELVRHVKRHRPEVKTLYMSGYTDSSLVRQGVLDLSTGHLNKPFTSEELAHAVRQALDEAAVVC